VLKTIKREGEKPSSSSSSERWRTHNFQIPVLLDMGLARSLPDRNGATVPGHRSCCNSREETQPYWWDVQQLAEHLKSCFWFS